MFISEALAQGTDAAAGTPSIFGSLGGMLPIVLMFVVLYFVMIRPQMKRQKEHKAMIEAVQKGDEVVTAGGLIGKIAKRPLRSGSAAASRDVSAPRVIDKDDMVTVVYTSGGVTLTLQAKAMGPAAAGEPVTVTNLQSKKVFQAIAESPGRAIVGPQADRLRASQTLALR